MVPYLYFVRQINPFLFSSKPHRTSLFQSLGFGTYAFLLSCVVSIHCPGIMIVVLASMECKSEANTISNFGTHIFMGPFGLVLRTSFFFCILRFTKDLVLIKSFDLEALGFDWFLTQDLEYIRFLDLESLAYELFRILDFLVSGSDFFRALAFGILDSEMTWNLGSEVLGSDIIRTSDSEALDSEPLSNYGIFRSFVCPLTKVE
jgi:hypothetical protein